MQAFLDGIGNALAAQSTAAQKCEAMAQLSTSGIPEKVSKAADEMLQREAAARVGLSPLSRKHLNLLSLLQCCTQPGSLPWAAERSVAVTRAPTKGI